MDYVARTGDLSKARVNCIVVPIFEDCALGDNASALNKASKGHIKKILNRGDISGKSGQTLLLHDVPNINAQRVLLVGAGNPETIDTQRYINICRSVINRLKTLSVKNVLCCLTDLDCGEHSAVWTTARLIEQFEGALYQFTDMKGEGTSDTAAPEITKVELYGPDRDAIEAMNLGITRGTALSLGLALAKDIANTPGNICHPTYLAEQAIELGEKYTNLDVSVLEENDMEQLGMGAFLSVSRGSEQPGKLITMEYQGTDADQKPHVLVGKGITFDTGGISLKAGALMHEMIYDMCGAASVLGTINAIAEQSLPINVVGVLAAAENMPSGNASRPGDIVTTMSGQTVEILNTDAEGRLVLCDALTYIDKFEPASVIDIATLTGAIVTSLGSVATGLFANDDQIARDIEEAGTQTHDRVWRMPIWEDYQPQLASAFADMANIGGKEAGSITAACFLARYTKKYRWAHLDIAGTGYQGSGGNKGYSGRPIPLLTAYLTALADE
jgi:leucyl aminopeptidase